MIDIVTILYEKQLINDFFGWKKKKIATRHVNKRRNYIEIYLNDNYH